MILILGVMVSWRCMLYTLPRKPCRDEQIINTHDCESCNMQNLARDRAGSISCAWDKGCSIKFQKTSFDLNRNGDIHPESSKSDVSPYLRETTLPAVSKSSHPRGEVFHASFAPQGEIKYLLVDTQLSMGEEIEHGKIKQKWRGRWRKHTC